MTFGKLSKKQLEQIKYINLHAHTTHSQLDGVGSVGAHIESCCENGHAGAAVTDHWSCAGLLELWSKGRDKKFYTEKLKRNSPYPTVLGCELYITDDVSVRDKDNKYNHVTVFAKNMAGYAALCRLSSIATQEDHKYMRPRISYGELLEAYQASGKSLCVTSGCFIGMIPQAIHRETGREEEIFNRFLKDFGEDFYTEIHISNLSMNWDPIQKKHIDQGVNPQEKVNLRIIELSKKYGVTMFITQDSHFPKESLYPIQTIAIQSAGGARGSNSWHFPESYHVMGIEEMYLKAQKYAKYISDEEFVSWCENSIKVLDKCRELELEFYPSLPKIDHEAHPVFNDPRWSSELDALYEKYKDSDKDLSGLIEQSRTDKTLNLVFKIIIERGRMKFHDDAYRQRLTRELDELQNNGIKPLLDYFIPEDEVVRFLKSKGLISNLGRGSAAGSLMAWAMGLVLPDPIKHGLLFERFFGRVRAGSLVFEHEGYPKSESKRQGVSLRVDSLSILSEHIIEDRLTDDIMTWLKKEIHWLDCNKDDIDYLLGLKKELRGQKIKNSPQSSVSYLIGLTDEKPKRKIDHIKGALPDFDFDTSTRDGVIEFLISKYGKDRVYLVGTRNTLAAKGALKDVIRVLAPEMPSQETNALTKKFDAVKRTDYKTEIEYFNAALEADPSLRVWFENNPKIKHGTVELLGNIKSTGTHAGGVIISDRDLKDVIPLEWVKDEQMWRTQLDKDQVEASGGVKYDFLGVKTLGDIDECFKLVRERHGIEIDETKIPMEDPAVFEDFRTGKTMSIFQFNTEFATGMLTGFKRPIKSVDELGLVTAMCRPGPMALIPQMLKRINGEEPVTYLHPLLEPILKDTGGIFCFQEQIMAAVQKIGGLLPHESLDVLKAMGKKQADKLDKFESKFTSYAVKIHGMEREIAQKIWNLCLEFAKYGFNACLTGETLVRKSDGSSISLDEISRMNLDKEPLHLESFNPKTGEVEADRCLQFYDNGEKEVFEVELEDGSIINCTIDHEFLCSDMKKHKLSEIIESELEIVAIKS